MIARVEKLGVLGWNNSSEAYRKSFYDKFYKAAEFKALLL